MHSAFQHWLRRANRFLKGRTKASSPPSRRLRIEALEDRVVPAALIEPGSEPTYVKNLYSEILGRAGSNSEVAGHVNNLHAGASPDAVADSFLGSSEYYTRRVRELYLDVLNRPADDAGLQGYVTQLQNPDTTERDVMAQLLTSDEYNTLHADNTNFVNALFQDALNRAPSAQELSTYLGHLAASGRDAVVDGVLGSLERSQVEVKGLFSSYLGRPADAQSLASMAGSLHQGGATFRQLSVTIVSSAENQLQALNPAAYAPIITNVVSTGENTVWVTFSEDMATNAISASRYRIKQGNHPHDTLNVSSAAFVGSSRNVVQLTTATQNDGLYELEINGTVTDLGNNRVDEDTEVEFVGTPPALDTDADGLSDFYENKGWQVSVTAANGTVTTRQVTSDKTKPDTDFDGLSDAREKELGTDPRDADTDNDELSDFAELVAQTVTYVDASGEPVPRQVTSSPLKADTDADGLNDAEERDSLTDPSDADTDDDDASDAQEVNGWQVSIQKVNGSSTQRDVTSDPLRPDTDGDGLSDRHELNLKTDPRSSDTDGDSLADQQEVIQVRSKPAHQDSDGDGVDDGTEFNVLHSPVNFAPTTPDTTAPGVAGAVSLGNTGLLVSFSEALGDGALDKANYYVTRSVGGTEVLALGIKSVRFADDGDRTTVVLETTSQDEGGYAITAVNLKDLSGNTLATIRGTFAGSPRSGAPLDSDGDGVSDVVEQRGWRVAVKMLDGRTEERWVTSDPLLTDTDEDGVADARELALSLDPRNVDTDADTLGDNLEVITIGSNASAQDSDGDGIDDASEFDDGGAGAVNNPPAPATPSDTTPPRVTGAASLGNTQVLVSFSEPMSDSVLNTAHYFIIQVNVNPEVGFVPVLSAAFNDAEHRSVLLTTASQNELTYTVNVLNVTDLAGNAPPPATFTASGQRIDPASATFPGTPASGIQIVDTEPLRDGDGNPSVPSSTSTANETITFGPIFATGTRVRVLATGGGLEPNTDYFLRNLGGSYSFFDTADHANDPASTTGRIELTGDVAALVFNPTTVISPTATDSSNETIRFGPIFATGTRVQVLATGGGLTVGTDYFLRDLGGPYSFFDTAAHAGDLASTTGRIDLTANVLDLIVGDGLPDSAEVRGWVVTVTLLDGTRFSRQVTSDPKLIDTDGDGLSDPQERNIGTDPRRADTDSDQINDYSEFNEVYSDATKQDTDGDGLDDFLEYTFFRTSPVFADTDGDQLRDDAEIFADRNPSISDLPVPEIRLGDMKLALDVRFTATTGTETRELDAFTVETILTQSQSQSHTQTSSATQNTWGKIGASQEFNIGEVKNAGVPRVTLTFSEEVGQSRTYSSSFSDTSAQATQRALAESQTTEEEVTVNEELVRTVEGASIETTLFLSNSSSVAYRIKNLQVTAFITDPRDPTSLVPVATLVPPVEPADGFLLGPLVPSRGPIVLRSDSVFPIVVESLMANPQSLVFRISNYDVIDEANRNFAFASQEVNERTARLTFDFGGFRGDEDGVEVAARTDATEIYRVATSYGRPIDTDGDGALGATDRRVSFDVTGQAVGITLRSALSFVGLAEYQVRLDANDLFVRDAQGRVQHYDADGEAVTLTPEQIATSYATYVVDTTVDGQPVQVERFFRVRERAREEGQPNTWEVLTPTGIDATRGPDEVILEAGTSVVLAFVEDKDGDFVPASLEEFYGTRDDSKDTDGDGLDDRFENFVGWEVEIPGSGRVRVTSSGSRSDTDGDGVPDWGEAPSRWVDADGDTFIDDGELTRAQPLAFSGNNVYSWIDADRDGVANANEVTLLTTYQVISPNFIRIQGAGAAIDGFYFVDVTTPGPGVSPYKGRTDYVTNPVDSDTDRDGLRDGAEVAGVSFTPIDSTTPITVTTNPEKVDTDGDGVGDGQEVRFGLNPRQDTDVDSDRDGLPDRVEEAGWTVSTFAVSTTPFAQGAQIQANRTSNPDAVDSDLDGLTDLEEFFMKTNPSSNDTDSDGIDDLAEALGYSLGHVVGTNDLGVIRTNPLDADTDNDLRSDGAEAELVDVETQRYVVRVTGEAPRQVFTNPLVADADFDGLVDGFEFLLKTDPNNGNTDGDNRDDLAEITVGTNPLADDFLVTVFFNKVRIDDDGDWDPGDEEGDFAFDLGVRLSGSGPAGLGDYVSAVRDSLRLTAPFDFSLSFGDKEVEPKLPGGPRGQQSLQNNTFSQGIAFDGDLADGDEDDAANAGSTLNLARYLPAADRSVTFGLTLDQAFSVEGIVAEMDLLPGRLFNSSNPADYRTYFVYLGGVDGLGAVKQDAGGTQNPTVRPVFRGSDLRVAETAFLDYKIVFEGTDNLQRGPGADGDVIGGFVTFTIFVS